MSIRRLLVITVAISILCVGGTAAFWIPPTPCHQQSLPGATVNTVQTAAVFASSRQSMLPICHGTGLSNINFTVKTAKNDNNDNNEPKHPPRLVQFVTNRMGAADFLEIRLDATLASIYVLSRFLVYDVTTGIKKVPGYELQDVIMLLDTFSSAIVLSILWTVAGTCTQIFEPQYQQSTSRIALTTLLAAPLWIYVEILLHWPPSGIDYANNYLILLSTGSIGLFVIMAFGRFVTTGWR